MKIQCGCGAKYNLDITPEMGHQPVQFVCSACGADASHYVTQLVRQALGITAPSPVPVAIALPLGQPVPSAPIALFVPAIAPPPPGYVAPPPQDYIAPPPVAYAHAPAVPQNLPAPVAVAAPPPPQPVPRMRVHLDAPAQVQQQYTPPPQTDATPRCLKHGGEPAIEKCFLCSKPICPKCMEIFGYLCSPLCKAKADSHGLDVPVFEGQKSVIEARIWRKTVRVASAVCAVLALVLGVWFWYAWFGSAPKPIFSVRLSNPAYSGQSAFAGTDQIFFLHGGTLARHDMKQKKEIWSRYLVDKEEIEKRITKIMKQAKVALDRANNEDPDNAPRMPDPQELRVDMERGAAASLQLRIVGQNIWVLSPGKVTRYDWEDGKPVKEIALKNEYGTLLHRGDELVLLDEEKGKQTLTRINLNSCETRTEDLIPQPPGNGATNGAASSTASRANKGSSTTATAGLPIGMPGKDADKPLDPTKVAQQAQNLSYPGKLALPAVLANSLTQERTLKELKDGSGKRPSNSSRKEPEEPFMLIPTKDGFIRLSTKLLEEKIVSRVAMKAAPGKSALDGEVNASKTVDVANEILNEMQRDRGGETVEEDESRYLVKLSDPDGNNQWSGEVIGQPQFFPLQTVNVLAANKSIIILDKSNKKLWQGSLIYGIVGSGGDPDAEETGTGEGPCVEHKGALYIFDQGVLTAFDLASGNVRWRVPSVGISGIFFDDKDMLYVNTTDASPDTIKFSRQIDISQKTASIFLKIDPKNGKTLWTIDPGGWVNYVSGKFIYAVQSNGPIEDDDRESFGTLPGMAGTKPHVRIKRINPSNGKIMWEHYEGRGPLDVEFDKNQIRIVFKKEVEVLKFLSL